jgi:hypothetical protein
MMEEGMATAIEYSWTGGFRRATQLRTVDIFMDPFVPVQDPVWNVWEVESGHQVDAEWLNYVTQDGSLWSAKAHATQGGGSVNAHFEHRPYPDGDSHDAEIIVFMDWAF